MVVAESSSTKRDKELVHPSSDSADVTVDCGRSCTWLARANPLPTSASLAPAVSCASV